MISRIDIEKTLRNSPNNECLFVSVATILNQLVDAVNGILDYAPLEMAMKAEPEKVNMDIESPVVVQQISYMAPGDITVFHGFNCSVEFDTPLPKGTRITIKSITKGGDNGL